MRKIFILPLFLLNGCLFFGGEALDDSSINVRDSGTTDLPVDMGQSDVINTDGGIPDMSIDPDVGSDMKPEKIFTVTSETEDIERICPDPS